MAQEHPNWVDERAKCNMGLLFDDLRDLIKKDVQRAKRKSQEQKWGKNYRIQNDGDAQITVTCSHQSGTEDCQFRLRGNRVHIISHPDQEYTIRTQWNAENIQCQIVVTLPTEDTVMFSHNQLWKAVQYVLEPFFFPPE
jgi:hypothetical protein